MYHLSNKYKMTLTLVKQRLFFFFFSWSKVTVQYQFQVYRKVIQIYIYIHMYRYISLQTMQGNCNHELKRCLLLGRKTWTNLDSILKSKDITLLTKIHILKALVFPIVMYVWELYHLRRIFSEELMLSNCGAGEDSWESTGLQGDPTSPS